MTILFMSDGHLGAVEAWVVERKGPDLDADVAELALMGRRSFGHCGRVLIKTGNAILPLEEEMMERLEVGAIPAESALHESESNVSVENEMVLFQGWLRVHVNLMATVRGGHCVWQTSA